MNELLIEIKEKSIDQDGKKTIGIFVQSLFRQKLLYKFFESKNGTWKVIKNFTEDNYVYWNPTEEGKYIIMIQAKEVDSTNSFDYVERVEYINEKESNDVVKMNIYNEKEKKQPNKGIYIQDIQKNNLEKFEEKIKCKFQYEYLNPYEELFEKKYAKVNNTSENNEEIEDNQKIKFRVEEELEHDNSKLIESETLTNKLFIMNDSENNIDIEEQYSEKYEESKKNVKVVEENELLVQDEVSEESEMKIEETNKLLEKRAIELINESPKHELVHQKSIANIDEGTEQEIDKISIVEEVDEDIEDIEDIEDTSEDINFNNLYKKDSDIIEIKDISYNEDILYPFITDEEKEALVSNKDSITARTMNVNMPEENFVEINEKAEDILKKSEHHEKLIKYILVGPRKNYCIGSQIVFTILSESKIPTVAKYKLYIDNKLVEELPYNHNKTFVIYPTCSGEYRVEFYSKYENSDTEYMDKKVQTLYVREADPIESIGISCDRTVIRCREDVTFMTTVRGGRNVLYEFYIFKDGNWCLEQEYSKKSYYTLMPFKEGTSKLLVLAKNYASEADYDEFIICKFNVEKNNTDIEDVFSMNYN